MPKKVRQIGVLSSEELLELVDEGRIINADDLDPRSLKRRIQPASIDLTLGTVAFRLQASFLPQPDNSVEARMEDLVMYKLDLMQGAILEKGAVYLIPLNEALRLPENIRGKTNPKSSTGRLDIFTRVITDHCTRFEEVTAGYSGKLYIEVVPRSFTIRVKTGQRLNQLRLFRVPTVDENVRHAEFFEAPGPHHYIGGPELVDLYKRKKLLIGEDGEFIGAARKHISGEGLLMSVDLSPSASNGGPVGFKAKKNSHVVDLEKIGHYKAADFWEQIHNPKNGRLILEPEEFYIFASKERIRVPLSCAAEMVEFDSGSGELRTHYAGFFDPGFGFGKEGEVKGTKAVLEVRPHDVPFIIEDGQILFKMKYERMAERPGIWYGSEIGSNYHDQTLRLSKQFHK